MTITFGSLFAGIGGFDLGLERAGMKCKWMVEIDEFCQKVLTKHWPDVPKYRDIKECGDNLERVDLICGGFPCQDVSTAGKRAGITGARSGLWSEYARIIRVLRPRYVLVENVPGLLSAGFGRVLGDLAKSGYDAEWANFYAATDTLAHLRERLFLVAYSGANRRRFLFTNNRNGKKTRSERESTPRESHLDSWNRKEIPLPTTIRMANGVPPELDRNYALGNAVVPQVAEFIGRRIVEFDKMQEIP